MPSSSVISGEKLIDELEHKLEAPLVPKGHPNTITDQDSDSNHILKDQEPETESAKSNGNGTNPQSEDVEDGKRVGTKREQLDIDEKELKGGFQNINNMGRFLKAAQIMGTRRLH